MLPPRFLSLLVLLLAVQAWSKPAKSIEGDEYSDDDPPEYNDDDIPLDDDDDDPGAFEEPPQIISKPERRIQRIGSTIMLPCLVKNTENTAVTWKKDNEFLYTDSSPITSETDRIVRLPNNTLMIYNAVINDSSNKYECSILSQPPITIRHMVYIIPDENENVIHVLPGKKVEVSAGETVSLGCETRIQPSPEVKWYHENETISDNVTVEGNRITIKNVNRHDSGRYQCLFEDGSKVPPMAGINLIVNYAPEIRAKGEVVHTGLGVESYLTCIVHAHPHAKVTWYKDQKDIIPEKGKVSFKKNETWHSLHILRTHEEDLGDYMCVATNKMGQATKTISLTGAPSQAVIYGGEMTRTDNGLILKWRLESYSPITEYKLQYRRKGEEQWTMVKPTVTNGKGNQFTVEHPIEGLQPGSYEAILMARNDFGWSQPSVPHTFTGEYVMEEAENVKGSAITSRPFGVVTLFLVVSSCAFISL